MNRLICLVLLLSICTISEAGRLGVNEIETSRGNLFADRVESSDGVPLRGARVSLGTATLHETDNYDFVYIEAAYPSEKSAELVLLQFGGGNACEGFFRVVDLRGNGQVKISEEFGNCHYLVQPKEWKPGDLKENPSFKDGAWYIALPSIERPADKLTWYIYKDGEVFEKGKGKVEHQGRDWQYDEKLANEVPEKNQREALIKEYGSASAAYFAILKQKAQKAVPAR